MHINYWSINYAYINHTADKTLMAAILNNFFASIFTAEYTKINHNDSQNQNNGAYLNTCIP